MQRVFILVSCFIAVAVAGPVFEATDANFDAQVINGGKNSFVKFYAPWCGHCKALKPDWDKLGSKFKTSDSVLIVDCDCTAACQGTCQKYGVKGYPTLNYFLAGNKKPVDYQQAREYPALESFVERTLNKPVCNIVSKAGCAANEIVFIEKNEAKTKEELEADAKAKDGELKELKKERDAFNAEAKSKEKAWKKKESAINKASAILKQMIKAK